MRLVQSKVLKTLLSFVLCLCFLFSTTASVYASTISDLRDKQDKIQSKINDTEKKLDSLKDKKEQTEEYLATLMTKVDLLKDQISSLQAEADKLQSSINSVQSSIDKTEREIENTQRKIDKKQKAFDDTYDEYCQRLRAMYISGSVSNLEVLLSSSDLSSILTRSQMIKSVSQQDSDTLDDLMKQMEEIEKDKADLEAKRIKLSEDKKKLQEEKKKLEENISTVKSKKAELDSEVDECNALMRKISNQESEYRELIEENEEQKAAVEREIQRAIAAAQQSSQTGGSSNGSYGSGNGSLGYPTAYRQISAGYPNYSNGRYHGGIDFPCPSGSSVYAAGSGTVILAQNLNYSYGHYLIIDHGDGLSTLYAHNTTLLVGVGQHVSKGQLIAYSGSTGNSTGPHCHFEVRVNGTRVNPFNYL